MAVLQAWSYRLPVLMTAACNLPEGFEEGAAHEFHLEPSQLIDDLRLFFRKTKVEQHAMGECGRDLVARRFTWSQVAEQMLAVYR